jgi:hypothetical protein
MLEVAERYEKIGAADADRTAGIPTWAAADRKRLCQEHHVLYCVKFFVWH